MPVAMAISFGVTALDAESRAAIGSAIVAAADSGAAVVVVTHELEQLSRVDAVIHMRAATRPAHS
jgi:zinc/manganese transport system ATP-binding protein